MRLILIFLFALLVLIQYPLWLGKGGWFRVWDLDQQVHSAQEKNDELKARNDKLASEVKDLKDGQEAVEERARSEMGMIKQDEIFVQILDANTSITVETAEALEEKRKAEIAKKKAETERRKAEAAATAAAAARR
jgi:cell division protein FtsB